MMLVVLRDSLIDASWPVRDRACIAIARYIRSVWDRSIDLTSSIDTRFIPIPTPDDIMMFNENIDNITNNKDEYQQNNNEKEEISIITIINEVIDILFNYLHNDSFRPVRESSAIAIIDCLLPPIIPTSNQNNQLKSLFLQNLWTKLETYVNTYLSSAISQTNLSLSISQELKVEQTKPINKSIRFLPDSIVAELMSGASVSVVNTNSNTSSVTTSITTTTVTAPVNPTPLVSSGIKLEKSSEIWGGSIKGKVKRSKPRLGGGWGCCLDCAAGEDRPLVSWEESETCIFLLKELVATFPDLETYESQIRVKSFLHHQLKVF